MAVGLAPVLGIETSCDETAAAVVDRNGRILANVVLSQEDHAAYGGVVPELASRAHLRALCAVCRQALYRAGLNWSDLGAIAVTRGPGLVGSLVVGVSLAKGLAISTGLPLVGVHHLEGHIFANRLGRGVPDCPFIALLVSGGHTELVMVRSWGVYECLGRTRDDAAGEAFDKVAKLLGLNPMQGVMAGGRRLSECALSGNPRAIVFPRALMGDSSADFSFSGLKTAVFNHLQRLDLWRLDESARRVQIADVAASFEAAVVDVLVSKTLRAVAQSGVKRVALAGGVAANRPLRRELGDALSKSGGRLFCPPPELCTDNAAMVAAAGMHRFEVGQGAGLELDAVPRLALA